MFHLCLNKTKLRITLLACAALTLISQRAAAQTAEADSATQPNMGSSSSPRGNETPHHEAGSAEATASSLRDKLFLRQTTVSSLSAIRLSELAIQRSSTDEMRKFASSVLAEHTKLLDGLKSTAETQGVMLPTKLPPREQALYDRLKGLSGEDFDREYIKAQAEDQHRVLHDFRSEAASTQDASLKTFVQDAAAGLHQQVVVADQIAEARGVPVERSTRNAAPPPPQ